MEGLEAAVRSLIDEAFRHQLLVLGALVGAILAATFLNRGARRPEGGD